jgi:hypothetical protein
MRRRRYWILAAFVLSLSDAHAEGKDWAWFVASSVIDEWNLEKGIAKVALTNTTFSAELYSGTELVHRLSGSRKGNQLQARISTVNSGRIDMPLSGQYSKRRYRGFRDTQGRETITLSVPGFVLGFTREIDN